MPGDYRILASIHNEIQIGAFAKQMTGRLLDYAQRNGWLGRQIMVPGCGTGESLSWLSQHHYIVSGIDESAEMLQIAKQNLGNSVQLTKGNFLSIQNNNEQDMVLALNVMSELNNIRELEQAFKHINSMLRPGKWFVFDIFTIEGLYQRNQDGYHLEYDKDGLTILLRNVFDYEKSIQTRTYTIFRQDGEHWTRTEGSLTLRAYPIQGVTALAQRSGFTVQHVLNRDMSQHTPGDSTSRVIIFAEKR